MLLSNFDSVATLLDNPVYNALLSGDSQLGIITGKVGYFDSEISPFAGFDEEYKSGFNDLHKILPARRNILYATRNTIDTPAGWKKIVHIPGTQFVYDTDKIPEQPAKDLIPLKDIHIGQMVALAKLTKPGPFDKRTIEFGSYYGIFDEERLVAMTGQRLHVDHYTEVSAVCTHPDYLGRGYAAALIEHQLGIILKAGRVPFLHVRSDNDRAIALYERLGFRKNGSMNFYFLKRE